MAKNNNDLSEGSGSTTGGRPSGSSYNRSEQSRSGSTWGSDTYSSGVREDHYGDRSRSRELVLSNRQSGSPDTTTIVGAALAGALLGAAIPFMLNRSGGSARTDRNREENAVVTESVIINRPAREIYDFWRDFTNLSRFMDNIKSVDKLDEKRSHWVIKAPAGTSVEFNSRVVDEVPGRLIAWESEEGASVPNRGRVEFIETSSGDGTNVRATISYDPPAGVAGRAIAKLFMREPGVQAREDLQRLKRLMESGTVDA